MNKEIKDRLDKLENELKESKNEIHSLKSSVSLTIEGGIRKLLSRFTRKQLILGSVIILFSISIIVDCFIPSLQNLSIIESIFLIILVLPSSETLH